MLHTRDPWDDWLSPLRTADLRFVYQERTADGELSTYCRLDPWRARKATLDARGRPRVHSLFSTIRADHSVRPAKLTYRYDALATASSSSSRDIEDRPEMSSSLAR